MHCYANCKMDRPIEIDMTAEINRVVVNMLRKCKLEANNKELEIPLEDFEERVAMYSGIPKSRLNKIAEKEKLSERYPKPHSIDFNIHKAILRCLIKFYEQGKMPHIRNLFESVNELVQTKQDIEQFRLDLSKLGLDYHPIFNDRRLFMEDPKITFERYTYLKKIREIRKRMPRPMIYYVGERIIDKNNMLNNPWKQNIHRSDITSGEFIFFHAMSRKGFENGLFCYSATEDDFYKWVVDVLLGALVPSSVVILDNSPLHGTFKSQTISMFDTKYEMQMWLRKRDIPYSSAMHKSQLYQLIKTHIDLDQLPRVDRAIKACGHDVLRLPTHFEDLSPIELVWELIRNTIVMQSDLHDEILSFFSNMPRKSYDLYEKAIEKRESDIFKLDSEMDEILDAYLTALKEQDK
uniref:Tc1-like transposase DDE domain-containing protein n=1 Tax=Heliothis virescens TaxID=7102 RepID=A0A2A4J6B8_HELVI